MKRDYLLLSIFFILLTYIASHSFLYKDIKVKADAEFSCVKDSDCPIGTCTNGKEFPQYSCLNGACNQILYFVDPCLDLSSSSSGSTSSNCKCNSDEYFNGETCIKNISGTTLACTLEYNPVCGCDGITYGNACSAKASGVKKFTSGECLSNSSSGLIKISKNFSGTWKGNINICSSPETTSDSSLDSSNCIVCTQVIEDCRPGFTFIPQSCKECGHCERCKNKTPIVLMLCVNDLTVEGTVTIGGIINDGDITSTKINSSSSIEITATDVNNNTKTLSLSLNRHRKLNGILDGQSFSLKKLGENKLCNCKNPCGDKCCKKNDDCLVLESFPVQYKCSPNSASSSSSGCPIPDCAAPPEGCSYIPEETSSGCPTGCGTLVCSSSGNISDCSSKGSCRSANGEELSCPAGTECSGLPAYGCYPPGCPVPICCSEETKLLTPKGQVKISKIKKGDYVISDNGEPAIVVEVRKVRVYNHKVMEVKLDDGTVLEVSPGHPIGPDSPKFGSLKVGYMLDGRTVVSSMEIPYKGKHTYDVLPYSLTGNYYANGVKIGSTLFMSTYLKKPKQW